MTLEEIQYSLSHFHSGIAMHNVMREIKIDALQLSSRLLSSSLSSLRRYYDVFWLKYVAEMNIQMIGRRLFPSLSLPFVATTAVKNTDWVFGE